MKRDHLLLIVIAFFCGLIGGVVANWVFTKTIDQKTDIEFWKILVQMAGLAGVACSVLMLRSQIMKTHEWNRRKAAQDLVDHMYRIGYYETTHKLRGITLPDGESIYDDRGKNKYKDIIDKLDEKQKEEVYRCLKTILAFCEEIALGVRHNIYDADIAYDYFGFLVPRDYSWAEAFIQRMREDTQDDTIYIEMQQLTDQWVERTREEKKIAQRAKQSDTKGPL